MQSSLKSGLSHWEPSTSHKWPVIRTPNIGTSNLKVYLKSRAYLQDRVTQISHLLVHSPKWPRQTGVDVTESPGTPPGSPAQQQGPKQLTPQMFPPQEHEQEAGSAPLSTRAALQCGMTVSRPQLQQLHHSAGPRGQSLKRPLNFIDNVHSDIQYINGRTLFW